MKRIAVRGLLLALALAAFEAGAADPEVDIDAAMAQCMSPCEPGRCVAADFPAPPNFDTAKSAILRNCAADEFRYAYAVEGACSDGAKILATGTGYTSNILLYAADGEFESQLVQTDVQSLPCMGQFYWPRYRQCESPVAVERMCGYLMQAGEPIFRDAWAE